MKTFKHKLLFLLADAAMHLIETTTVLRHSRKHCQNKGRGEREKEKAREVRRGRERVRNVRRAMVSRVKASESRQRVSSSLIHTLYFLLRDRAQQQSTNDRVF